jgi:hypothetical protein
MSAGHTRRPLAGKIGTALVSSHSWPNKLRSAYSRTGTDQIDSAFHAGKNNSWPVAGAWSPHPTCRSIPPQWAVKAMEPARRSQPVVCGKNSSVTHENFFAMGPTVLPRRVLREDDGSSRRLSRLGMSASPPTPERVVAKQRTDASGQNQTHGLEQELPIARSSCWLRSA